MCTFHVQACTTAALVEVVRMKLQHPGRSESPTPHWARSHGASPPLFLHQPLATSACQRAPALGRTRLHYRLRLNTSPDPCIGHTASAGRFVSNCHHRFQRAGTCRDQRSGRSFQAHTSRQYLLFDRTSLAPWPCPEQRQCSDPITELPWRSAANSL